MILRAIQTHGGGKEENSQMTNKVGMREGCNTLSIAALFDPLAEVVQFAEPQDRVRPKCRRQIPHQAIERDVPVAFFPSWSAPCRISKLLL